MTKEPVNPILIRVPMPIETPRLILRGIERGDGEALFEAKAETLDLLRPWMPWAKELGTVEDSEKFASEAHAKFLLREDLMILGFEKANGKLVVSKGLHRMDWNERIFEIGYWVRKSEQNKGIATETTAALIHYAFNALAATTVRIAHDIGNDASERVIRKLGFEEVDPADNSRWYKRTNTDGLPHLKVTW